VKPSSHASTSFEVVPVLAALGQPIADSVAVPYSTLCSRISVSTAVAALESTLTRWGLPQLESTRPFGKTTLVIVICLLR
jgi:hypothetical protein